MKKLLAGFLCTALAVSFGCNENKSAPGGPGASTPGKAGRDTAFTINPPSTTTSIKQGEEKEVTIAINRGKEFKQDVKISLSTEEKGVTITPNPAELKASDNKTELTFHVKADRDAAIGEHTITVKATPETGSPTETPFKVKVTGA
jgi:uncharacterized membrane protein